MILGVFIEFFRVKIAIGLSKNHCDLIITVGFDLSQNSRYISDISDILPIYLRYFTDISQIFIDIFPIFTDILSIFFQKFQHMRAWDVLSLFCQNIENFRYFAKISVILPIFKVGWHNRIGTGRYPIFRRYIGRYIRFFVPCLYL